MQIVRKTHAPRLLRTVALTTTVLLLVLSCGTSVSAETLTLDRALEIAFENSPTMRQAGLGLEVSEHNLKANQASLKSQFNLTLSPYSYYKDRVFDDSESLFKTQEQTSTSAQFSITQPIALTDGTLSITESIDWRDASSELRDNVTLKTKEYSNRLTLNFNQPLFTYNRTQLTSRELELALEDAQLNYVIQKLTIESRVTQEFLALYHDQQSVQISREEYENSSESYDIIKSKVDAGISAQEELYQAELTKAQSRATLENNQIAYENALDNFKILLGLDLNQKLEVVADVRKRLVEVNLAQAIDHGLANRMELRQRDIDIQNAMYDLVRTGALNEFRASVDLSYGLTGTDENFSDIYKSPTRTQSVGFTVNIPLFDWGQKKHSIAASEAQLERQKISASEEQKNVMYEIRQAYRNLLNQKTQIEIAETNVKNARLTYEINLERYKNGDLSSKDMSFYQTQLSQEQLNEVAALINYQVALLNLKITSLFDFEKNTPVVDEI